VAADRPVEAELRRLNAHAQTNPVRTAGIPWQARCRAWWGSRAETPSTPTSCAQAATSARFAFYGRTSTVVYQDRCTARGWQREVEESVIAGRGFDAIVVGEYRIDDFWAHDR